MASWYDELLKADFPTFIGKTLSTVDPAATYQPNWHINVIAEYLEAIRRKEINRLIINLPPRSLKSVCVSVAWPAWLLGHSPQSRIIAASYAASLSIKHSLDCRLTLNSPWYKQLFPDTRLSRDQNEKHKFVTTQRGSRFATSVGGSVLGEGGNYLIIDDPINPTQAMNRDLRNHVNRWFEHTFATRLDDKKKGAIILVMQRLHEHDLSGYLLGKNHWEHLCIPAIAPQPMHYRMGTVSKFRHEGELLHEAREDDVLIERAKIELGSNAFAAQYQQQPIPEEGGMVKMAWFKRYQTLPDSIERRVQSWDTAIKSGNHHDASVCLTFAQCKECSYLMDVQIMRLEYPDLKKTVYELAERVKPDVILIEDRASGQQLLQDIRRETMLPVIGMSSQKDKVTRFGAVSALIEAGRLYLPENAVWLADFKNEISAFPNGNHDDQVDALTQYLDWLRNAVWKPVSIRSV